MLEESHHYFQKASDVLDLSHNLREILLTPFRVVKSKSSLKAIREIFNITWVIASNTIKLVVRSRVGYDITRRWTKIMPWPWPT